MSVDEAVIFQEPYELYSADLKNESDYFVTIQDLPNVCRTCLSQADLKSIFHISYEGISLIELLKLCTSIQV